MVDRCICRDRSFKEVLEYAKEHELTTTNALEAADFCCTNCKLCEPYIELALETGQTEFVPGAFIRQP